MRKSLFVVMVLAVVLVFCASVYAQNDPKQNVRIVIPDGAEERVTKAGTGAAKIEYVVYDNEGGEIVLGQTSLSLEQVMAQLGAIEAEIAMLENPDILAQRVADANERKVKWVALRDKIIGKEVEAGPEPIE